MHVSHRARPLLLALTCAGIALSTPSQAQQKDGLYDRIERHLAETPALAAAVGKPAAEMAAVSWLVGEWDVVATDTQPGSQPSKGSASITPLYGGVWLEMRDTYPSGNQDLGYLGFSVTSRRWINVSMDAYGHANLVSTDAWRDDRLVFEADFVIMGVATHLRQTFRKLNEDSFRVDNEERIGGAWRPVDAYVYTRKPAS